MAAIRAYERSLANDGQGQADDIYVNRQQNRQQERDVMRRVAHESLIDRYMKLIPKVRFRKGDKGIDEFNTTECVICMETFDGGEKVRKVPSCRHIFHDDCLMKWLSGS